MATLSVKDYDFCYPESGEQTLNQLNFFVAEGDFVVLCGESGSGKTTLLKLIKHDIAPFGTQSGRIDFRGQKIESYTQLERSQQIGFVFQKPEAQIVMGTVLDELVFGMENIGMPTTTMQKRLAEVVQFLGIEALLYNDIHALSGGQLQLVNLASILMLYPDVLLLDEPTSQLDPIARQQFVQILQRLNKEQGMTIIISEHNLDEILDIADQILLLDKGKLRYKGKPQDVIKEMQKDGFTASYLPLVTQLYLQKSRVPTTGEVPLNVKETKDWLSAQHIIEKNRPKTETNTGETILKIDRLDYQYERKGQFIIDQLSAEFRQGEIHAILGGNGSGKTTLLKLLANILHPQSGKLWLEGEKMGEVDMSTISYLPQDPLLFFIEDEILAEYESIAKNYQLKEERINEVMDLFSLKPLANRHPYDLSGGQLQKASIAGALLPHPKVLLLDEPSKGIDPAAKEELGKLLKRLSKAGQTIIMVTHDIEFVAKWADRCSLLFNGKLTATETAENFFVNNYYYTTAMARVSRAVVEQPVITLNEAVKQWDVQ